MDIEKIGVGILKVALGRTERLRADIRDNDTVPVWDGEVFVYRDSRKANSSLIGRVPLQVKTTTQQNQQKIKNVVYFAFDMDMEDAKNYYNDGGVIYFVIYVANDKELIYYKTLLPADLYYLINTKPNKTKQRIKCKKFPNAVNDIECIFLDFLQHRDKQRSIKEVGIQTDEKLHLAGYTEHFFTTNTAGPLDLVGQDLYVYAKNSLGSIACSGIKTVLQVQISDPNATLTVQGKEFFRGGSLEKNSEGLIFKFGGNNIILSINNNSRINLSMGTSGKLSYHMHCLDFIEAVNKNHEFSINGEHVKILSSRENLEAQNNNIKCVKDNRQILLTIKAMLKAFGLKEDPILSDPSVINTLYRVGKSLLEEIPVKIQQVSETGLVRIKLENDKYLLFKVQPCNSESYLIKSPFDAVEPLKIGFQDNHGIEQTIFVSYFLSLHENDFYNATNMDLDFIHKDVISYTDGEYKDLKINFILIHYWFKLVKAFDKTNNQEFLERASNVLNTLNNMDGLNSSLNAALLINKWQLIRRQRKFSQQEHQDIKAFIAASENQEIIIAGNILLGNKELALSLIENLDTESQSRFKTYPIYNLVSIE